MDWGLGDFRSVEWAHPEVEFVIGGWPSLAGRSGALEWLSPFVLGRRSGRTDTSAQTDTWS
jgi:hypothetical protein